MNRRSTRWPFTVQAAYFGMTLQVVTVLLGLVIAAPAAVLTMTNPALWAYAATLATALGLTIQVMRRFPARGGRVRWAAVALQVAGAGVYLVVAALDPGLDAGSFVSLNLVVPAFVVVMLLTPAAARWFGG